MTEPHSVPLPSPEELLALTGTRRCLFGDARQIRQICEIVRKVARSSGPVLIRGESGTGKEVLASAIHRQSPRVSKPFVPLHAGAIPRELFESELFGHCKGAFTGADRDRTGAFDQADGGTLFLDEIGDMPVDHQVKLLRALQSGEIRPVGATQAHRVNVRVVAATNRDLESLIRDGRFREDLYYRLSLFVITIPPLRERREDIVPLAEIFARRFYAEQGGTGNLTISPAARRLLLEYAWPGNIRELENAVHHAVTFQEGGVIQPDDLPESVRTGQAPMLRTQPSPSGRTPSPEPPFEHLDADRTVEPLAEVERRHILYVYEQMQGNKTRTAQALGISLRSLQMKLKAFGRHN